MRYCWATPKILSNSHIACVCWWSTPWPLRGFEQSGWRFETRRPWCTMQTCSYWMYSYIWWGVPLCIAPPNLEPLSHTVYQPLSTHAIIMRSIVGTLTPKLLPLKSQVTACLSVESNIKSTSFGVVLRFPSAICVPIRLNLLPYIAPQSIESVQRVIGHFNDGTHSAGLQNVV